MGLLDIKPNEVSKDLSGYSVLFYGTPKSGKTTTASKFPGALIFAFEKGYSAIPGAMAQPIFSWGEFKKFARELKNDDVKATFKTIIIDTADIAYDYCSKYICSQASDAQHEYESLGDIPYGKGYKMAELEFDQCMRDILMLDYGLVLISHATEKTFTATDGSQYDQIIPTLDNRARKICERTCDIIGYSHAEFDKENGGTKTWLELRGTPRYVAGSRFRYTPDRIEFSYDNLVKVIADAIDEEAKNGGKVTTKKSNIHKEVTQEFDYDQLMTDINMIIGNLMNANQANSKKIKAIIDEHLGKGKKVVDATPTNCPQLDLILTDLKALQADLA